MFNKRVVITNFITCFNQNFTTQILQLKIFQSNEPSVHIFTAESQPPKISS